LEKIISRKRKGGILQGEMEGEIKLNEEFTEQALRAASIARYPVVHLATHFQFRPGDAENLWGTGCKPESEERRLRKRRFRSPVDRR
jgi:hypothetical protein